MQSKFNVATTGHSRRRTQQVRTFKRLPTPRMREPADELVAIQEMRNIREDKSNIETSSAPATSPADKDKQGDSNQEVQGASKLCYLPPDQLKAHPFNVEIYGNELPGKDLIESITNDGVLQPILATPEFLILSGHRRHLACKEVGIKEVPVIITWKAGDLLAQKAFLIDANRQRKKTPEQVAREAHAMMEIEQERAKRRQGAAAGGRPVPTESSEQKGDAAKIVAAKLGTGQSKVKQSCVVIDELKKAEAEGRTNDAEDIKGRLEKSINKAYRQAKAIQAFKKEGLEMPTHENPSPAQAPIQPGSKADLIERLENLMQGTVTWSLEKLGRFITYVEAFEPVGEQEQVDEMEVA